MIRSHQPVSSLKESDTVVVYPSFGYLVDNGTAWRLLLSGIVSEPGTVTLGKRMMLRLLQQVMKVSAADLDCEIFRQRIGAFLATTERGKRITLQVGATLHTMRQRTRRNGHFQGALRIATEQADQLAAEGLLTDNWLRVGVLRRAGHPPSSPGQVQLIAPQGVSVISDIDDTIKHTGVCHREALLANTFLRDFQSIEGMAERYALWSRSDVAIHYVSSSPWQLYEPLETMCREHGFPAGSFHLRLFRLRDHMLRRVLFRRGGKLETMKRILRVFPQRQFVLIGDSGERDPELYGRLARKFPRQVRAIYIRELAGRPLDAARGRRAFRGLEKHHWQVFQHPHELPERLPSMAPEPITPCV